MKKKASSPEELGSWMDTYGDMVTLLLCFFVLLYSISSVDQVKWENLVKSLNPEAAKEVSQVVLDPELNNGEEDVPGSTQLEESADVEMVDENAMSEEMTEAQAEQINEQFNTMFEDLQALKDEASGGSTDVEIAQGDGYTFITFRDRVFFDGDSWVMRKEGKKMMDKFAEIVKPCASAIKEIQIFGHTSQADPNKQNNVDTDRTLSAMRSAVVTAYLQKKNVVDPSKLISSSFGQFHPIASFDTAEDRAKNRRVEILITKTGNVERTLDEYYDQIYDKITE